MTVRGRLGLYSRIRPELGTYANWFVKSGVLRTAFGVQSVAGSLPLHPEAKGNFVLTTTIRARKRMMTRKRR